LGEGYVRVEIWLRPDDPLIEFLSKKSVNGEPLGRVAKRELRRIMFMDRIAELDKRIDSALRLAHRRMKELGLPA